MRLHHVGFVVRDGNRAARSFDEPHFRQLTDPVEDPVQRVVVQFFAERATELVWELIWPLGDVDASPLSSRLKRGGGFDHVCYELEAADESMEAVVAHEKQNGAMIVCQPVFAQAFGRRVAFVFRKSGAVVEFVEMRATGQLV